MEFLTNKAIPFFLQPFTYNRLSFFYDRMMRQHMEYFTAEMRIKQVSLWREDVRDLFEFTPRKMEVYLLVEAILLNTAALALCKARLPPGSPHWLVACHLLSISCAILYLIMGIWFGFQAFVTAQAYKVRILTQDVRLPVPTWTALEAGRSYGSQYERLRARQMFRIPVIRKQERQAAAMAGARPNDPDTWGQESSIAADPWDLERRVGDGCFPELEPDVNTKKVAEQRHVWQVREASRFFQTYDAFCRVALSAGTSSLASFFCFFCLSSVSMENAAPLAAWGGMAIFSFISIILIRSDLVLTDNYRALCSVLLAAPISICGVVSFVSSRNGGHTGSWGYLMPVALAIQGAWYAFFNEVIYVEAATTGVVLPLSFKNVLFSDVFGWAKLSSTSSWRRGPAAATQAVLTPRVQEAGQSNRKGPLLPSAVCCNPNNPLRPEDVESAWRYHTENAYTVANWTQGAGLDPDAGFETYQREHSNTREGGYTRGYHHQTGLAPWRTFQVNTWFVALMWWLAAVISLHAATFGEESLPNRRVNTHLPGELPLVHVLLGLPVRTGWHAALERPHGLTCDADGKVFVTAGRWSNGRTGLLMSQLAKEIDGTQQVYFDAAPGCEGLTQAGYGIRDISIQSCTPEGVCKVIVLPSQATDLIQCQVSLAELPGHLGTSSNMSAQSLGRAWLEDRGGSVLEEIPGSGSTDYLQPEEISAVELAPCGAKAAGKGIRNCAVMGTTGRRVVLMAPSGALNGQLLPKSLLQHDVYEPLAPGSFALLGEGRFLAMLNRGSGLVRLLDLHRGGHAAATWQLPLRGANTHWSGICAGGGALWGMEAKGGVPSLWRFRLPYLPA